MTHKIAWTEKTWSPITGCTKISEGCASCYAEKMAKRLRGRCGYPADDQFRVTFRQDKLGQPAKWRKPKMVFVCSMGDLFHDDVRDVAIDQVYAAMALAPRHTYQVLTKRPAKMRRYMDLCTDNLEHNIGHQIRLLSNGEHSGLIEMPFPNVWHGVSAENQRRFNERAQHLLETPSVVRFVSLEPLLGPIDFTGLIQPDGDHGLRSLGGGTGIDWVIVGSESRGGRTGRGCMLEWVRDIKDQCEEAGVPLFIKQLHIDGRLVKNIEEFPKDLRIREWPL